MQKQTSIVKADQFARKYYSQGYHCSEATVRAILESIEPTADPQMIRISTPFCGGMSGTQSNACGVLSGALIVIGAKLGRSLPEEDDTICMAAAKEYFEAFKNMANCGSVNCNTLREFRPNNSCMEYVVKGAILAVQIIEKHQTG